MKISANKSKKKDEKIASSLYKNFSSLSTKYMFSREEMNCIKRSYKTLLHLHFSTKKQYFDYIENNINDIKNLFSKFRKNDKK